ncbi:MAG: BamA/TamA family outer membrane protein [Bacteroidetes bacterium]|nr:BamA/TamA family outer membrane protein [Bacteroidota bacterium]
MKNSLCLLLITIGLLLTSSCASYKLKYSKEGKNWEQDTPPASLKLNHRLYLIGDAGNAPKDGTVPVLAYLKNRLPKEGENSSALFLGDNIYYKGMPPKEDVEKRVLAEHRIMTQLEILDNFKGRALFIPGNHDWRYGVKGVRRQEKFVNKYLNKLKGIEDDDQEGWESYFLPSGGCAGLDIVEINEQLVYIIVDSQWYVTDWDKEPSINDGCDIKNREMFMFMFETILRKNRDKNVVVALHHPPYTNGPHGGKYPAKTHLFPLTEKYDNLYIPLPGLGTLYAFLRGSIGSRQDMPSQIYQEMATGMVSGAKKNGDYIFVSGHEHALQYLENEGQHFIVSGSGSKHNPVGMGKGAYFAYGKEGFSTIDFYETGEAWAQFWIVDESGTSAKVVFQKKIKEKLASVEASVTTDFPEFENMPEKVETTPIRDEINPVSGFHNVVLGKHYRNVYLEKYPFPTLDLSTFEGGLTPVKRGGGGQTNSLRMESATGHQYVLRDLTKDVTRLLPFPFNKMTAATNIIMDNFLSSHPFAPLAVPPLADAINIYHTNPNLYYVPKQPALGDFNDIFGGSVYLLEERPGGDWSGTGIFGDAEKIISTPDVADKIVDNNKHVIDQSWTLRTRLFDLLLGDWDRHDDQWRWTRFKTDDDKNIYRPVPRDRDQAFSLYDGLLMKAAKIAAVPAVRQIQAYGPEMGNMKWDTWSPRRFDNSFINELEWEEWEVEAKFIKEHLTDEIIDQAFTTWPDRVQQMTAEPIKVALKKRRDDIVTIANQHFRLLSEKVDVYGTDEPELFEIVRENNSQVLVTVFELNKKGEKKEKVYERRFESDVTKEIDIYGIGDDDEFRVSGEVGKSILIRLIGGQGKDVFVDESKVTGGKKMTLIYDDLRENKVQKSAETKDMRSTRRILNIYDRTANHYEYDMFMPLPVVAFNPDDGFTLGADLKWLTFEFKKEPYASMHKVNMGYSFESESLFLNYSGDYLNTFGKFDFLLDVTLRGPSYAHNYFGFGNESKADFETNELDYYRVRQSLIRINPSLKKRFAGHGGQITIGPVFETSKIKDTKNRFITSEEIEVSEEFFDHQYFAGAKLGFNYVNLDNWVVPHQGIRFNSSIDWLNSFQKEGDNFASLKADFSIYQNLDRAQNIIFATRIGVKHNLGEGYHFYHASDLGGKESLRGYHNERFYGKTAFWQNVDLRTRLFSSYNEALPFTLGFFAGFDYGRVWEKDDTLESWHYNYGGGIWMAPADALTFSLGLFQPKEDTEGGPRFMFKMGMGF